MKPVWQWNLCVKRARRLRADCRLPAALRRRVIRSVPANAYDSVYCVRLAHAAVHAAMAGRTEVVVGRWHGRFVHIPIPVAISRRSTVDPDGDLWLSVLEATGQPARLGRASAVLA